MRNYLGFFTLILAIVVVLLCVLSPTGAPPHAKGPIDSLMELYLYDFTDQNGVYRELPIFGKSDRVVVRKAVVDALPDRSDDFRFIGNRIEDREAFVLQSNKDFAHKDRKWDTFITESELIGGKTRLLICANVGINRTVQSPLGRSGHGILVDHSVHELWELHPNSQPVLLDRSFDLFDGLQTHAESPVSNDPLPPVQLFGDPN